MGPGALLALVLLFLWCLLLAGVAAAVALWALHRRRASDPARVAPQDAAPPPIAAAPPPRDPEPPAPSSPAPETASELASLPPEAPDLGA